MQLSKKLKNFSNFLTGFLKYTFTFEHFEEQHEPDSVCISECHFRKT